MRNIKFFIFLILFIIVFSNLAIGQDLLVIKNTDEVINLASYASVYEDKTNLLVMTDILKNKKQISFTRPTISTLSFGFSSSSFWIKTSIASNDLASLAIQINNTLLDSIQFYIVAQDSIIAQKQAGMLIPFKERDTNTNHYIFDLVNTPTATCDIYIRVKNRFAIDASAFIGSEKTFLEENAFDKFFNGLYSGFLLLMILYNLFIYFSVRDIGYLLYVLNCFCLGLSFFTNQGFLYQFIYPDFPFINQYIDYINVTCLTIICNIIFAMEFLQVRRYFNYSYYIAIILIFILFLLIILDLTGYSSIAFISSQVILLTIAAFAIFVPIYIYKKGFKPAFFFLLAWIGVILGGVIDILAANQILPSNQFTNNAYRIGTAWEMLLLSFALAYKINVYKEERRQALAENFRLVEEQNKNLEAKVKERTNELENANAEILTQNEELHQQQEELTVTNETLATTFKQLKSTSDRLNKSIQYAYSIQQIILPQKDTLDSFFQSHFSVYLPKDVVSGDFYWFTILNDDMAIFALADCTGHGVPGAFMSMIGNTLLHEITKTKNIYNPAEILLNLHHGIRHVLKQDKSHNSDGMDISVCLFEKQKNLNTYKITFAGAKSDMFYQNEKQIHQVDGDRVNIGGFTERKREFTNQIITLPKGSIIYFTSDGYIDQHNVARKRFTTYQFKELLQKIYEQEISEQEKTIRKTLKEHQQGEEQRDDISVVGIRL